MSNKISELNTSGPAGNVPAGTARAASVPSAGTGSAPASGGSSGSGEVHITDTAASLSTLEQAVRSAPEVDTARVAQLRSAIAQDRYAVSPPDIAVKLMQLEDDLGPLIGPG